MRPVLLVLLVVPSLLARLNPADFISESPVTRRSALKELATLPTGQKAAYVSRLIYVMRQPGAQRGRMVVAFAKIGPTAVPELLPLVEDEDTSIRLLSAQALAMIRPVSPATIERLKKALQDPVEDVRFVAGEALLSLGFEDQEIQNNVTAYWQRPLGSYSRDRAAGAHVATLIAAMRGNDPDAAANAVETLRVLHLYRPEIEVVCIEALKGPSRRVAEGAARILQFWFTEEARDAVLDYEIAEAVRKKEAEERVRSERLHPWKLADIVAPIPADADHNYPLDVANQFETKAADGTIVLAVLQTGTERRDRLRIWRKAGDDYFLLVQDIAEQFSHLSANSFRYQGRTYLHVMALQQGTGHSHSDDIYRVESGKLVKLAMPKGLPIKLATDEGVWKGFLESFQDDGLTFEFWIWKPHDANCCPSGGAVKGSYAIIGDRLIFASWKRITFESGR